MIKKISAKIIALVLVFTVTGCTSSITSTEASSVGNVFSKTETSPTTTTTISEVENVITTNDSSDTLFTNEYKYTDEDINSEYTEVTAEINLSDSQTTMTGTGAIISGSFIEITSGGTFVVSGKLTDGQIAINAPSTATVKLVLNGVNITSNKNSAIYCMQANKLIVTLAENTENILTDAETYTYVDTTKEEPDATLFSKKDLSINGLGTLTINSNFNNGIGTKDDLIIASGNINVTSVNNAIRGRDSILVLGGTFNITSQNDGLQSNNDEDVSKGGIIIEDGTFNINADHDAIQAETSIKISGGEFNLTTGSGNKVVHEAVAEDSGLSDSYKGIKADGNILIEDGTFNIDSSDDNFNSNGSIQILNGNFTLSTGDDAIHADENLTVVNGTIKILTSVEGLEAQVVTIDGGDIDITASDDAINASDGSTTSTTTTPGEMWQGGEPPADFDPNATRPQRPDGEGVVPADGEMPQAPPDGMMPNAGNRPQNTALDNGLAIYINGGVLKIDSGGDSLDSNGNAIITGGEIYINGPGTGGNGILDSDGSFAINGGVIIGVENSDGSQISSSSTQPYFSIYFSSVQTAGKVITIKSAAGKVLATFTPSKDFKILLVSTSDLKVGETYTVYINDVKIVDVPVTAIANSISDTGTAVQQGGMQGGRGNRGTRTQ